jgi:hypothetical protein
MISFFFLLQNVIKFVQKLGLEWTCERFCIGKKRKVCNVLLWVWRSSVWMKEKEIWKNLVFCFVRIERVWKRRHRLLKMLGILEGGSKARKKKVHFCFCFFVF